MPNTIVSSRGRRAAALATAVALIALLPRTASAQQRPLVTEDPETVGAGRLLIEAGFDYLRDAEFPVSGLEGDLVRLPGFGLSVGISSIAELQIDGGLRRLRVDRRSPLAPLASMVEVPGDSTSAVDDLVVGTKVRILSEGASRPGFAVRFATRLPNASNESGLGLDTTDFFASAIAGKTTQSVRIVGNVGVGILGDPTRGDRQNDVLTYGVSFARAVTPRAEVVGEVNGRASTRGGEAPPGTESRSILRVGARYTVAAVRADAGLLVGLTAPDPGWGFTAGVTWVLDAFQVP